MSDEPSSRTGTETTLYRDGKPVARYSQDVPILARQWKNRPLTDLPSLKGPKLKVERAKRHIAELQALAEAFYDRNPYELVAEEDPETGEYVHRMRVKEDVPIEASVIVGDVVHNLRCALDYLVGDLARDNDAAPHQNAGLSIERRPERLKPGTVTKIKGVSARAERLILWLKACKALNPPLWQLHWLDITDKHNSIILIGAATVQVTAMVGVRGLFTGPDGSARIGGPGPGGAPFMVDAGTPHDFKRVFPIEDNVEIHRTPAGFNEEIKAFTQISLGESEIPKGEPVIETLQQLTTLVEGIISIFERHALKNRGNPAG